MTTRKTLLSLLVGGAFAIAGAHAQTAPAAGDSDGPPAAGEASNMTRGVPNAKTTNSPFTEKPLPGQPYTAVVIPRAEPPVAAVVIQQDDANRATYRAATVMGAPPSYATIYADPAPPVGYGTQPANVLPNNPPLNRGGTPQ